MADTLLFEQSTEQQGTPEPFISRQVVQVLDQNGGNYNGQIQIDTSSLSNSGKYASYGEAYLVIPLVTRLTATGATAGGALTGVDCPLGVGLKCGSHQLIHSLSVSYNNSDVVQLTPYNNFYVQYKLMSSMSWDDVRKIGPSIGFYPDTADTFYYRVGAGGTTGDRSGYGMCNNRNYPYGGAVTSTSTGLTAADTAAPNAGLLQRQRWNNVSHDTAPITTLMDETNAKALGKNLYMEDDGTYSKVWYTLAKIRLKDLHSFFEQLPLVKGAFLSIRLNTNTASNTINITSDGTAANAIVYCSATTISGGTTPHMLTSGYTNNGLNALVAAAGALAAATYEFTLKSSIGSDTALTSTFQSHPAWGAQCRLFVPMYQMSPIKEEQYLSLNRTKKIVYQDIYSYQTDVTAGDPFNVLLTNGIPNPTTVVCIPITAASSNGVHKTFATHKVAGHQSPFSAEPGTTSPFGALTDFNVQVAGINMFTQNEVYDFEQFMNELSSQNAINGNLVNGLTSGLINEADFETGYRYYVCDVSRRLPSEDNVPKSISIQGKNKSKLNLSIYTFIVFERSITIDVASGEKLA